ncbi:hypothetical protein AB4Y33_43085, partial [Paraburkholderia sp. BR14319]
LAVAYSVANPLLHHLWFALTGATEHFSESLFSMFVGDLAGTLILVYIVKGTLALLPRHPSQSSRMTDGMFRIRLALDLAYNNR